MKNPVVAPLRRRTTSIVVLHEQEYIYEQAGLASSSKNTTQSGQSVSHILDPPFLAQLLEHSPRSLTGSPPGSIIISGNDQSLGSPLPSDSR